MSEFVIMRGDDPAARSAALNLRARCFREGRSDHDAFDDIAEHFVIAGTGGETLAAFRVLPFNTGAEVEASYSAQFYNLSNLAQFDQPCLEIGRFCVNPNHLNPDIIRFAWAKLADLVAEREAQLLFGCSSFMVKEEREISMALALLAREFTAPKQFAPMPRAPHTVPLEPGDTPVDRRAALQQLPPLLKTYLRMGGWVSDHAVIDHDLGTVHVFTGVEVAKIPETRTRSIRSASGV